MSLESKFPPGYITAMAGVLAGCLLLAALQQAPDEKKVRELVKQLDAEDQAVREEAHQVLSRMGPAVAPLLEPFRSAASPEVASRVDAILKRLQIDADFRKRLPDVARVTILRGTRTVAEVLRLLQEQTGLRVRVRSLNVRASAEVGWDGATVLQALDDLCRALGKGAVVAPPLAGADEEMQMMLRHSRHGGREGEVDLAIDGSGSPPPATAHSDHFRLALNDVVITESRSASGVQTTATLHLSLSSQPGVQPLYVGPLEVVEAVDDQGRSLKEGAGIAGLAAAFGRGEAAPEVGEDLGAVQFGGDEWSRFGRYQNPSLRPPEPGAKRIARLKVKTRVGFALRQVSPSLTLKQVAEGARLELGGATVVILKAEPRQKGFYAEWRTEGKFTGTPTLIPVNAAGSPLNTSGYSGGGSAASDTATSRRMLSMEQGFSRIRWWVDRRNSRVVGFSTSPVMKIIRSARAGALRRRRS